MAMFGILKKRSSASSSTLSTAVLSLILAAMPLHAEAGSVTYQKLARLPLAFEQQSASEFVARGQGYMIKVGGPSATIRVEQRTIAMEFINGHRNKSSAGNELPGKINYIYGSEQRHWRIGVPTFGSVTYHEVYPGIDVVYHGNQSNLEFDFTLKPRADPGVIRMGFTGAGRPSIDESGSLVLGDLRLKAPKVLQGDKVIPGRYRVLRNNEVDLQLGAYDRLRPLVIDPTLVYSTRLGGGSDGNQGNAIALDASRNAYIAGYTRTADFPVVKSRVFC